MFDLRTPILCFFTSAVLSLVGCAHGSQITPFRGTQASLVSPARVQILRTKGPFTSFNELGLISFRSRSFDVAAIYEQLRADAGEYGAHAVIDLKITEESHIETKQVEKCERKIVCDSGHCEQKEVCDMVPKSEKVTTYLASGTMIRSKK